MEFAFVSKENCRGQACVRGVSQCRPSREAITSSCEIGAQDIRWQRDTCQGDPLTGNGPQPKRKKYTVDKKKGGE